MIESITIPDTYHVDPYPAFTYRLRSTTPKLALKRMQRVVHAWDVGPVKRDRYAKVPVIGTDLDEPETQARRRRLCAIMSNLSRVFQDTGYGRYRQLACIVDGRTDPLSDKLGQVLEIVDVLEAGVGEVFGPNPDSHHSDGKNGDLGKKLRDRRYRIRDTLVGNYLQYATIGIEIPNDQGRRVMEAWIWFDQEES